MVLKVICKSCFKETQIKKQALSRSELEDKIGADFSHRCARCGVNKKYHVNQVKAHNSNGPKMIGSFFGFIILIGVTAYFLMTGYLTNIGLIIGGTIIGASQFAGRNSNAAIFNNYKINTRDFTRKEGSD